MNRNALLCIVALILTLPIGELHHCFNNDLNNIQEPSWFLFSDIKQDVKWYVKDTAEGIAWIVVLIVWYIREKRRSNVFASAALFLLLYRIGDLVMYWVNFRQSGFWYVGGVYGLIIVILIWNYKKMTKRTNG